jgi:hypothetical protein
MGETSDKSHTFTFGPARGERVEQSDFAAFSLCDCYRLPASVIVPQTFAIKVHNVDGLFCGGGSVPGRRQGSRSGVMSSHETVGMAPRWPAGRNRARRRTAIGVELMEARTPRAGWTQRASRRSSGIPISRYLDRLRAGSRSQAPLASRAIEASIATLPASGGAPQSPSPVGRASGPHCRIVRRAVPRRYRRRTVTGWQLGA